MIDIIQIIINASLSIAILLLLYAIWILNNKIIMLQAQVRINSAYVMKRIK